MINEKWILKNKKADLVSMSQKYSISQLLCKLLVNRQIVEDEIVKSYVNPIYDNLHNPKEMKDMDKAVKLLKRDILEGNKIRIVGDYDVDGVISVFVLYTGLKRCGANVDYEIPDRIKDGYGINKNIIKIAYEDSINTILTCDNGISAIDQIEYAKELGLNVIVTDHHDIPFVEEEGVRTFVKPKADAIINPKQEECSYKFKSICGAGVAYKLIESMYTEFNISKDEAYKLIEFVAIATVCDVVDLIDENRVFVKNGLEMINNTKNIGLQELKNATSLENKETTAYHLGFIIGPCINASGRLDSAKKGLELLLCDDRDKAKTLAEEIVVLNNERKDMTKTGVEQAIEIIENTSIINDNILVIYIPDIHESLAGIVAGRIKEKYNKPTIVLTKAEEGVKGSARSIEEYNIFEGLLECKDVLDKFGGHPMAAGLSLQENNIDILRMKLNRNCNLTDDDLARKIMIDLALPLECISIELVDELKKLEPFGKGNSKPVFGAKNAIVSKATVLGKDKNVLKLRLITKDNSCMDAMIFNNLENFENKVIEKYGQEALNNLYNKNQNNIMMDFTFYPSINEWNGNKSIQIIVDGIR